MSVEEELYALEAAAFLGLPIEIYKQLPWLHPTNEDSNE